MAFESGMYSRFKLDVNFTQKKFELIYSKLLEYYVNNNIYELRIPTQKENILACAFYNKNGYHIIEETIIKH